MKKTLFALLACAAVMPAMAANWDLEYVKFAFYDNYKTPADYTLYLYKDVATDITSVTASIQDMGLTAFTESTLGEYAFTRKTATGILTNGTVVTTNIDGTIPYNTIWGVCVYHGEDAAAAFAVASPNAEVAQTGKLNFQSTSGFTEFKSPATPEPATATLSLMALAGLCARRRRH